LIDTSKSSLKAYLYNYLNEEFMEEFKEGVEKEDKANYFNENQGVNK